jgi:UDP-glucose 4-epimerase
MLAAAAPHDACGKPINIAGGIGLSVNDLFCEIKALLASELAPSYVPERVGDVLHSVASTTRARELLGFTPELDLAQGLARSIDWYRADFLAQRAGR